MNTSGALFAGLVDGQFYPSGSSQSHSLTLQVFDSGQVLLAGLDAPDLSLERVMFCQLKVTGRIGDSPRHIRFPDNSLFETEDNDGVDGLLRHFETGIGSRLVNRLESGWRYAVATLAIVTVALWFGVAVVMPWAAERVAMTVPATMAQSVGEGSLQILDTYIFTPSQLDIGRQQELEQKFQNMLAGIESNGLKYQLIFRSSDDIGPNAFALPDGTIVMTDKLVELADYDEQLLSIMAHEIGHVWHRHALRGVLQSSGMTVLLVMVTGDVMSVANLAAAIPVLLVEASYSRDMESQADEYALSFMQQQGMDPESFASIMEKMMTWADEQSEEGLSIPGLLSSHPDIAERIAKFRN